MPKTVGLDLGTYSCKIIQGKPGSKPAVDRAIEIFNPVGAVLPNDDGTAQRLGEFIATQFADHKLDKVDVRIALPESLLSTKIIGIPALTDAELASAIQWQAEQYIPIPFDELSLEYKVLSRPKAKTPNALMHVMMVGARKTVVDQYLDIFLRAGVEPSVLETQILAVLRSLEFAPDEPTTMVVHMGSSNTDVVIVHEGEVQFVYTFPMGGALLTRALEQGAQLDAKQAEEYKRSYGMDPSQLGGRLRELMVPLVQQQVAELQKANQFFVSQQPGASVKRLLLSGGAAQLPGLVQMLTEQMGMEVLVAAPFASATGTPPETNHPAYAVAMGLLMREK